MVSEIERWARIERQFLRDEKKWLEAGGRVISPSGDDITAKQIAQLDARIEHLQKALGDA